MKAVDILIRARAIIETPDKWTQGTLARDAGGKPCYVAYQVPVCFCMMGAVQAAELEQPLGEYIPCDQYMPALHDAAGGKVAKFNDHPNTTHADVLAVFDKAIAKLEAKS